MQSARASKTSPRPTVKEPTDSYDSFESRPEDLGRLFRFIEVGIDLQDTYHFGIGVMQRSSCTACGSLLYEGVKFCPACGIPVRSAHQVSSEAHIPSVAKVHKKVISPRVRMLYTFLVLVLLGFFIFIFMNHLPGGSHPVIANQPDVAMASMFTDVKLVPQPITVQVSGGTISFPMSELLTRKMVEFDYQSDNVMIPLLAFISPEGKLVTAIRICEPCNSHTFRIEGTELACGNCETRWKLNNLEGIQGSCQKYPPAPIPSRLVGNEVQIDERVVRNWKMRI